ncbi:hypothetical protein K4L44_09170 [Halosquirtibacter laminarini]|uniref:Uncharacterized protein n=1 Tax=Halosquirtibacter laminarini TaxID=3374600 RepID=A0AC61NBD2_9BACT|nr:hypothetical protein K4L44_09170 [Prolixibacteraceae bacterium]
MNATARLNHYGITATPEREKILDLLIVEGTCSLNRLSELSVDVDRTTIFRMVRLFQLYGILEERIEMNDTKVFRILPWDPLTIDKNPINFHCKECKSVLKLPWSKSILRAIPASFCVESANLELYGICPECQS